ncbi:MAG TPA: hypothetical protein VNT29_06150, partial [Candidatus Limnocylindrales bacterium]|nr:hypothetical protein [Candidatus Limnocylindrales bacterium]
LPTFAPLTLAILAPGESVMLVEWDGKRGTIGPARTPLISSSSFERDSVEAARRDDFVRHRQRGKSLFEFHASHNPSSGAHSVCMHRDDAETVSFSWVRVSGTEVNFFYAPGSPCRWMPGEQQTLELRKAA